MKITICIGSSCHLKGSREVVEQLQKLVADKKLQDQVELSGTFCLGNCVNGVNVMIGEQIFSVKPETTRSFFESEVESRLAGVAI